MTHCGEQITTEDIAVHMPKAVQDNQLCIASSSAYCPLSRSLCLKRQGNVLEAVVQGQVASEYSGFVILSRPGRSGGHKPGFEEIRGREP